MASVDLTSGEQLWSSYAKDPRWRAELEIGQSVSLGFQLHDTTEALALAAIQDIPDTENAGASLMAVDGRTGRTRWVVPVVAPEPRRDGRVRSSFGVVGAAGDVVVVQSGPADAVAGGEPRPDVMTIRGLSANDGSTFWERKYFAAQHVAQGRVLGHHPPDPGCCVMESSGCWGPRPV
ncbi:hypothetical protein [Aestuariimicrobium ganziense]|uniref:hypothetical protein n=1 Tax=Aestuariimicrobium ganziense TaxID=2773677 RepID=UPI0019435AF4|nr:hypothetical protein [Aestuariimicrobium ganziense]